MSTFETLFEKARELAPLLREHSRNSELERRVSPVVHEALLEAGLYRLWRPRSLGGFELDPVSGFRILEELSRADSAVGWNASLANNTEIFGAWFEDDVASEVFGNESTVFAGAFNPPRQAIPVDGGYRVSGSTWFNSGVHGATWIVGLALIFEDEEMRLNADGSPEVIMTLVPAEEVDIVDNWDTMGMRGTGSHDVEMRDVFVPDHHTVPWRPLEDPSAAFAGPLYQLTVWPVVASLAVPALGIARAAIDELIALASTKTPAYTGTALKDRSVVQAQLASAEASLGSGRAYLYRVFEEAFHAAEAGGQLDMDDKCQAQLAITNAVLASANAVDLVHAAVGASGIRRELPFEKHFRDVHVLTQHALISAARYEAAGQILLGSEPDWPFFGF